MKNPFLQVVLSLLRSVASTDVDRDAMIGDLEEEHTERLVIDGRWCADRWLLNQFVVSVWPLLRTRLDCQSLRRSTAVVFFAWLSWAGVFAALVATSVWLFRVVPIAPALRILVYLSVAFLAAVTSGLFVRRACPGAGVGVSVGLAGTLVATIALMFAGSPEQQGTAVWMVWAMVVMAGVFTGTHGLTTQAREMAR